MNPQEISGTVIIVPLINVASFQRIVPHLNPVDGKNMNRFFPGTPQGTQTERASLAVTRAVIEQSDHVIDMHGGDIDENLRPYSYWTVTGNAAQDSISRAMVLAFGLDHIIISRDRPKDVNASRYLENTASLRGKPSITVEAGRAGTVEPQDVQVLIDGSDSNTATIAQGYALAIINQYLAGRLGREGRAPAVEVKSRIWYNPELKSVNFIVPGIIAVIMMIVGADSRFLSLVIRSIVSRRSLTDPNWARSSAFSLDSSLIRSLASLSVAGCSGRPQLVSSG